MNWESPDESGILRELGKLSKKLAAAEADRDRLREALRRVLENEGGCDTANLTRGVPPCRVRYPADKNLWCGSCVAYDAMVEIVRPGTTSDSA